MEVNLLDKMLADYQDRNLVVNIVLQNKVRVSGKIRSFDSYVIILENQKNEIVYRHAISSLSQAVVAVAAKSAQQRPAPRPQKSAAQSAKSRHPQHPARPAAQSDASINTGMKDGLLRWMEGQKAPK